MQTAESAATIQVLQQKNQALLEIAAKNVSSLEELKKFQEAAVPVKTPPVIVTAAAATAATKEEGEEGGEEYKKPLTLGRGRKRKGAFWLVLW